MTKITWKTEKRKVKSLIPADYNPRKMTEEERRDLEESIKEFGQVIPVVINIGKRKDVLIGGHQRATLYADLGYEDVEVMVPSRELNQAEEKKLNLRLNKNTGSWDFDKLKEMNLEVLLEVGFGDEELQMFFDDVDMLDDGFNLGRALKEIKIPKAKLGDVYELGSHRLMCGDATKEEDVKKLMSEDTADLIYCDAPEKIDFMATKEKKKDGDYAEFVSTTLKNAISVAKPNTHVFYWCDEKYIWLLQTLFAENKIKNERVCLWITNNTTPKPQVAFNKVYEPCVYGTMGKPYLNKDLKSSNEILNKDVTTGNQMHEEVLEMLTIWLDRKDPSASTEYPNHKPVTLAEKPFKRCSAPGHIILDLFGGSGSTLIACEQIKRQARVMQMDPILVDIIINRWEQFTNLKAKKIK